MKKIVLTGGGTAGHIYPALAVAENLSSDYDIHFVGGNGMEKDIIAKEKNITFHEIRAVKLERKLTLKNLLIPFKLNAAIKDAKKVLQEIKPNVIFSKGGFVSVPTVIAAKRLGIPVVSHESDLSFGLANKIILKRCNKMCCTFRQTAKNKKCVFTGQPIRKKVFVGDKFKILRQGDFDKNLPNLLIIGGSLGANFINQKVWNNLDKLTQKFNVVHLTGKQADIVHTHKNYLQVPYADNVGDYYAFADFAISRAGSGVINELLALRIPALLIPLSKKCSRGDQIENAKLFQNLGVADMLHEEDYSDEKLFLKLDNLIKNSEKIKKNMQKTQNFNSCEEIIKIIKAVEKKNPLS